MTGTDNLDFDSANGILIDNEIQWVITQFTDMFGELRSFSLPVKSYLSGAIWRHGVNFDGSSVGYRQAEDSDITAKPDPTTLHILPVDPSNGQRRARVTCSVFDSRNGQPYYADPRQIADRTFKKANEAGYKFTNFLPEMEFYLFTSRKSAMVQNDVWSNESSIGIGHLYGIPDLIEPNLGTLYTSKPRRGYALSAPKDKGEAYRNELSTLLEDLGIPVKYHHHENGTSQMEVEFDFLPSLVQTADAVANYKYYGRIVAQKYGYIPCFMPKPLFADAGNGMHVHMYLGGENDNRFYDKDNPDGLSQEARYYIGGILDHAAGMAAITNPTVNSYKRLVPEFEAPVYTAWSMHNRTTMVRIPAKFGDKSAIDVEARQSDTSANPYLAFSTILAAGLDGIKKKIEPGDPINEDVNKLSASQRKELGIGQLPRTLQEALDLMETDDLVKDTLGNECFERYMEIKKKEVFQFNVHISTWEHWMYFDI